ncbi:MAG: class I SAM-dependent methyltransferase [Fimbriimonadaceae bacterium]|nr:MAG: class I SAM-dependent methyltransferase [Fimbriimonadaceae bacterium]
MNRDEYAKMRSLEDHYWWFVSRRDLALRLLDQFAPPGELSILDVGCGTGAVLTELESRGQAVGLDLSHDALRYSAERGLKNLIYANAEQLPFDSESFQAVVSLDTLEHVPDHESAVKEIYRCLSPGGVFVMNVPAFAWLWGPHDVALMHQRRYTRRQVKQLLNGAGFEIQRLSYSVFFLFPAVMLRRLLDKLQRGEPQVKLPQFTRFTNGVLNALMQGETSLFLKHNLPYGSSVVCVATKPAGEKRG